MLIICKNQGGASLLDIKELVVMKKKITDVIFIVNAVIILISAYLFYNSLRFAYHYYHFYGSPYINPVRAELIQPFLFSFVLTLMIFLLLEHKEKIKYLAAGAFLFLILFNPTVQTYENRVMQGDIKNLEANPTIQFLDKIDLLNILNTDFYKKEVSAIVICCFLLYLMRDLHIRYQLPKIGILTAEVVVSSLGVLCMTWDPKEGILSFNSFYGYIIIGVLILCFLAAKGLAGLMKKYKEQRLMLGLVAMIIPWLTNIVLDTEYSDPEDVLALFVIPFIYIGFFTFLCYAIELGNQEKKPEKQPESDT